MIKKTRRKFVLIIMVIMTLVLALIFGALNLIMYSSGEHQVERALEQLAQNEGVPRRPDQQKFDSTSPPSYTDKTGDSTDSSTIPIPPSRFPSSDSSNSESSSADGVVSEPEGNTLSVPNPEEFSFFRLWDGLFSSGDVPRILSDFSVKVGFQGDILSVLPDTPYGMTESEVSALVSAALEMDISRGTVQNFRFLSQERQYGRILVFHDNTFERSVQLRLFFITSVIFLCSLAVVFFISLFLSAWAMRPVKDAFQKQRQFVADASHELKTPVTVIRANTDLLEGEVGPNRWLTSIRGEGERMQALVNELLLLAKYDISGRAFTKLQFDLSKTIQGAVLSFECLVYEQGQKLITRIDDGLTFSGDEQRIKQLCAILLDNAVKYTPKGGTITVILTAHGRSKQLTVRNTGAGIDEVEQAKIFERFYRTDSSRARNTGGFGLGLAIAKSIVDAHGGKITVDSQQGDYVDFIVTLF